MERQEVKLHRGTVNITPGVLDNESEYAFSGGHCHSLAFAIARARDLNVVVVGRRPRGGGPLEPMHTLVELPDGRWADVRGIYEGGASYDATLNAAVRNEVGASVIVSADEAPALIKAGKHKWLKEDPMLAASFIEPVLERWGVDSPELAASNDQHQIEL